jgi:hypothetical protein
VWLSSVFSPAMNGGAQAFTRIITRGRFNCSPRLPQVLPFCPLRVLYFCL